MISFPNAKINIGLNVTGKRPDGYHSIESVFFPVGLQDVLEFIKQEKPVPGYILFHTSGIEIKEDGKENLCIRAYRLLAQDHKLPCLSVHLHKIIPTGSGLGGGSSDASGMIRMLNDHCDLNLSVAEMQEYAGKIGSDCPFFIENKPALVSGKGELSEPVSLDLKKYSIVIACPDIHISTAEAYSRIKLSVPDIPLKELIKLPIEQWKGKIQNDFEKVIFPLYPRIEKIRDLFYQKGALYASMTGSGSGVYGLFDREWKEEIGFDDCFVWRGVL